MCGGFGGAVRVYAGQGEVDARPGLPFVDAVLDDGALVADFDDPCANLDMFP